MIRLRPFPPNKIVLYFLIFILAVFSNIPLFHGQFRGEDEADQWWSTTRMIQSIKQFDVVGLARNVVGQYHPPLRYLLSLPGTWILPHSEFGLRMFSILSSFIMTFLVIKVGQSLGGNVVGWVSGILIASSPIYNQTSMAFSESVTACVLLISMKILCTRSQDIYTPQGKNVFIFINFLIIIAFLINTGNILFFPSILLVFFWKNRQQWQSLIRLCIPFAVFYLGYYLVFLIIAPYIGRLVLGKTLISGQLHQNITRAKLVNLNASFFIDNLRAVNGYFFPYLSWIIFVAAIIYIIYRHPHLAVFLSLFTIAWSLLLSSGSEYFLLVFIALFPFGINKIYEWLGRRFFIPLSLLSCIILLSWNYTIFIRPYGSGELSYQYSLIHYGLANINRFHNISEPYNQLGSDINKLLDKNKLFIHDISGSFTIFYYKDDPSKLYHTRYGGRFCTDQYPCIYDSQNKCYDIVPQQYAQIQIIITAKELCPGSFVKVNKYPKSELKLFVLDPSHP